MTRLPCIGVNATPCLLRATCRHYLLFRDKYANRDNLPTAWIKPLYDPEKGCPSYNEAPQHLFAKRNRIY